MLGQHPVLGDSSTVPCAGPSPTPLLPHGTHVLPLGWKPLDSPLLPPSLLPCLCTPRFCSSTDVQIRPH